MAWGFQEAAAAGVVSVDGVRSFKIILSILFILCSSICSI